MKISILIPIYNVEKYLRQCLDSILNQKDIKDVALDIVLVDDGSTDKSLDIAIEYAKKDERIFVLSKKNAGLSTARNAAIELMKGTKLRAYLENEIKENDFSIKSYKNTHSFDKTDIKKISKEDIDKNFIKLDERVYKTELSDINDLILQDLPDDVYVHFLDSDDCLDESCISTCKRYIQEKDLNLYLHNLSSVDENSKLIKEKIYLALNLKLGFYDNGLDFLQDNKLHDFYFAYQGA
ncbi:glycosyltransferase family 2 protein [Campylobacter avium]|uniref:glycosyltransferase family 2 protein n=1 Tax=Campylobacter avium TaxID=522485 RepID=UPI00235690E9|nr:glycosyltransferase [Campylobacter avium]